MARLNCYGEAFEEMRERLDGIEPAIEVGQRKRLQAEIDEAVYDLFELTNEEREVIEEYLEMF